MSPLNTPSLLSKAVIFLITLTFLIPGGLWAAAGQTAKIVFLRGDVVASNSALPEPRKLSKGSRLEPGDRVKTSPKALAQILLPDATLLYLKADSELKLESFHFEKQAPEKDDVSVELIKGGLRTLSGKISKRSPDSAKYKTAVATIGLRGTVVRFEVTDDGSLNVHFITGEGNLTNGQVKQAIETGQAYTANPDFSFTITDWPLDKGDPAQIFMDIINKSYDEANAIVEQTNLSDEEKILLIAMDGQIPSGTDLGSAIMQAFAGDSDVAIAGTILSIATEINTDKADALLKSSITGGMDAKVALSSVLSGMGDASTEQINQVIKSSIEAGVEPGEAYEVLIESVDSACK